MTEAKGLAVLASTTALATALTLSASATPAQPKAEDVRDQIMQLLEDGALYRNRIDWPTARQQLRDAKTPAEADSIIKKTIASSTANHGRWIRASALPNVAGTPQLAQADKPQQPNTSNDGSGASQAGARANDPIGLISIPAFMDSPKAQGAARYQRRLTFARQLQSTLRTEDEHDRCGWIVDLRQNQGGNMWPMLVGISPLLSTDPKKREVIGAFDAGGTHQLWSLDSGLVLLGERAPVTLDTPNYVLRHHSPPVAVLIGPMTGSSGEAVALAFRGRPATRSFGQETAGFSTANRPTPLLDGSVLLLTGSVSVDRNLKGDGGKLKPDVTVGDTDDDAKAARSWLIEQASCKALRRTQP